MSRAGTVILGLLLLGCGGQDPQATYEEAYAAFDEASSSEDYAAILDQLDGLTADLKASGDTSLGYQVAYLRVRCQARNGDPQAYDTLMKLETDYPEKMAEVNAFLEVCQDLARAGKAGAQKAVEVIAHCQKRFPESNDKLATMAGNIAELGGEEAASALRGLGYLGNK